MKIEHKEQQKNKLLVDKSVPDLNGMLCSLCQKITLSVCQLGVTILLYNSMRTLQHAIYWSMLVNSFKPNILNAVSHLTPKINT